jgi:hypothetical protein
MFVFSLLGIYKLTSYFFGPLGLILDSSITMSFFYILISAISLKSKVITGTINLVVGNTFGFY